MKSLLAGKRGYERSERRISSGKSHKIVFMITPIITTTLKYPAAVGEARNVEPHDEGLEPGEKPANTAILESVSGAFR